MDLCYLSYLNDHLVGIVQLIGKMSDNSLDKFGGTSSFLKAMGFNSIADYLTFLPGFSLERLPLKDYDMVLPLTLEYKIGIHAVRVGFNLSLYEHIVEAYDKTNDWSDAEFYIQPKIEQVRWLPYGDNGHLWYCEDWMDLA